MSTRSEVLLWAQRVLAKKSAPAHELLEIAASSSSEDAQGAFHKIARLAHPDLHRNALTADDLDTVTRAYSVAAGAYQAFRGQAMQTLRMRPLKPEDIRAAAGSGRPAAAPVPVTPSGPAPLGGASSQMTPKALTYYRKAELALRRGDLKGALLQLKMAIATDPQSAFLRTALAEVEIEVLKGP
ncbi:MAG: hypothetical protein JWO36_2042 [Myxococcales bacterium]|nr:hypothetical protein [Myxococcales bacterium]